MVESGIKSIIVRAMTTSAIVLVPAIAHAQETATQAEPTPEASEIVVTATKRGDRLQDAPLAVSAVTSVALEQQNITALSGVQHIVPNIRFATVTGTPQIFVRGVGGGGRNIGFEPRNGVYLDGVFIGDTGALDAALVGVERVEVLRGPQGFLFGQSTDAGAINVVTKAPSPDLHIDGSVAYGRWNDLRGMVSVTGPVSDKIYALFSAIGQRRAGYIRNVFDGDKLGDLQNYGFRSRIRFQPTEDFTFDLAADYSSRRSNIVTGEPITNVFGTAPEGLPPYTINQNDPESDERDSGGVSATARYEGSALDVTSITAYRVSNRRWLVDVDHSTSNLLNIDFRDYYRTFSQELTLVSSSKTDRLRYLAGLYFSYASNSADRFIQLGSDAGLVRRTPFASSTTRPNLDVRTLSFYGSVDYDILPELTLNVGGRLQFERRVLNQSQGPLPDLGYSAVVNFRDSRKDNSFMPTASLTFKPSNDLTVYAKYAKGVKSGGFNADFALTSVSSGRPYQFAAEKVDSFEFGTKSSLFDRKLTANASVFLNNFSNYQVFQYQVLNGFSFLSLANAAAVRTYGVELELEARPVEGLVLAANGSRLWANYRNFPNGGGVGVDYTDNRLEYAPEWTFSGRVDYTHDISAMDGGYLMVGADYSFRSDSYSDASNAARFRMGESQLVAARVGVGTRGNDKVNWLLSVSGENLTKNSAFNNISVSGFGRTLGFREMPRRYLMKFEIHY